jgi:hypothetical protein
MLVLRFVFAVVFAIEGRYGAEELVGDVGEDGGTARRDAILRDEKEQAGEEIVDVGGGVELAESRGKGVREIGGRSAILRELGVAGAEASVGGGDGKAAAGAIREAVFAARRVCGGIELGWVIGHFLFGSFG